MAISRRSVSVEAQMAACIRRHRLLRGVRRLGIAVSGGADSVALLRAILPFCHEARVTPVVLHLDHGLRGAVSSADARFVARLAKHLGLACRVDALPGGLSRRSRTSLEMAAREARQAFYRRVAAEERLDAIATGHTADDVAETLLLRLMRGSGATGLSGLRPCHVVAGVPFVRPLLTCFHADTQAWLRHHGWTWREDASNRDQSIPRNRLRCSVLPWLEEHGSPSIRAMLAQSAAILRDEDGLLDAWAERALRRLGKSGAVAAREDACFPDRRQCVGRELDGTRLLSLPMALRRRVLRKWLLACGFSGAAGWNAVECVLERLEATSPWQVSLPGDLLIRQRGGMLDIRQNARRAGRGDPVRRQRPAVLQDEDQRLGAARGGGCRPVSAVAAADTLTVPGTVTVAGVRVTARPSRGFVATRGPVGTLPSACALDAESLRGKPIIVRTRRPGDRIRPLGMQGSKALQDLFVDAKVPFEQRDRLPVVVVGDEIAWVPGFRVHCAYAVRAPDAASVRIRMARAGRCETIVSRHGMALPPDKKDAQEDVGAPPDGAILHDDD